MAKNSFSAEDWFSGFKPPEEVKRDPVREAYYELKRGDVITVGRSKWMVFQSEYGGVQRYLYKYGSKGKKAYTSFLGRDGNVEVFEVDGMGNLKGLVTSGPFARTGERVSM